MELADGARTIPARCPTQGCQFQILTSSNFLLPLFSNFHLNSLSSLLTMESLSDTQWDVVISGTGLQQSLLAL